MRKGYKKNADLRAGVSILCILSPKTQPNLGKYFLYFIKGTSAKVGRAEHFCLRLFDQFSQRFDVVIAQAVVGTDGKLELVDRLFQELISCTRGIPFCNLDKLEKILLVKLSFEEIGRLARTTRRKRCTAVEMVEKKDRHFSILRFGISAQYNNTSIYCSQV